MKNFMWTATTLIFSSRFLMEASSTDDRLNETEGKSNFKGLGPQTGLFDVEYKERLNSENFRCIRLEVNRQGFSPAIQFQQSVAYNTYFNDDKNHLRLRLSYDSQYWWRINQMAFVNDTINNSNFAVKYQRYSEDASLMGITFDARVDF